MKGQGAMEYLMTYGWAILIVIIVGVALWLSGVFNTSTESVTGFKYVRILDYSYDSGGSLHVVYENTLGYNMQNVNITYYGDASGPSSCTGNCTWPRGKTYQDHTTDTCTPGQPYIIHVNITWKSGYSGLTKTDHGTITGTCQPSPTPPPETHYWITATETQFNQGTYNQTRYSTTGGYVQLNPGQTTGTYTSKIHDANNTATWNQIKWYQETCYQCPLPDNQQTETGHYTKPANMTGNVLLMHMNEASGNIQDSSGNGNHGTPEGTILYDLPGKLGKAIAFDRDARIRISNSQSLNLTNQMTLEAWVKPKNNEGMKRGFAGSDWKYERPVNISPATPVNDYQLKIILNTTNFNYSHANPDGSDLRFYQENGSKIPYWIEEWNNTGTSTVWVRIPNAGTDRILMYYGNPGASSESNGTAVFDFFENMETWQGWNQYNGGQVSQSSARAYEGTYSAHKTTNNDPNGAWKAFGKTLGRNIIVESWVNRNSGYTGGPWDRVGVTDGSGNGYGSGANLPGDDILIDVRTGMSGSMYVTYNVIPSIPYDEWYLQRLIIKGDGTVHAEFEYPKGNIVASMSINHNSYSSFTRYYIAGGHDYWVDLVRVRKYANPEPVAGLGEETSAVMLKPGAYGISANTTTAFGMINNQTISAPLPSDWNHIVLTYDGSYQKLYVNGQLAASQAMTGPINTNTNDVLIGDDYRGTVDEIAIYNRTLSQEEVQEHYKRGVLQLNLSMRTCDDPACDTEAWTSIPGPSPQSLSLPNNRYAQFKYYFQTQDSSVTPELYNVTVKYTTSP